MATAVVVFLGTAVASKLVGYALDKALGVQVEGSSVGDWGQQIALGIFFGQGLIPDLTFEQKVDLRFQQLESEIAGLRQDIADLKNQMENFEWQVQTLLYEAREEDLWQTMLQIENSAEPYYKGLSTLGKSTESLEKRQEQALRLSNDILTGPIITNIANSRLAIMGDDVGAGGERVRGLLEIWQEQALREADLGWTGGRLSQIYNLLEQKFTRALLIQVKCARLLIEAQEAQHQNDASQPGGIDYYADTLYPLLVEEVIGFRNIIEALAVNLLPLPNIPLASLNVPGELAGMLASVDVFTAQALSGKISDTKAPAGGRTLPDVPALSGCWGRVLVPGTRWIRRAAGSKENAKLAISGPGWSGVLKGTLEMRSIDYVPYQGQSGSTLHSGYQLYVATEPRDMTAMLLAQFTPADVLPANLSGSMDVKLLDDKGTTLAQTQATMVPIPIDEAGTNKAPFGTFTMTFTGGAEVRGK